MDLVPVDRDGKVVVRGAISPLELVHVVPEWLTSRVVV